MGRCWNLFVDKKCFKLYFIEKVLMDKKEYKNLKNKKNINHPELKEGEVWITNIPIEPGPLEPDFPLMSRKKTRLSDIGWSTKRVGAIAYTTDNKIHGGHIPVFVQRTELEKAKIDMRTILPKPITTV